MINYQHIADAENYYQKLGYKLVQVPWIVSERAYYTTKPKGAWDVVVSAEKDLGEKEGAYPANRSNLERDGDDKLIAAEELSGYLCASGEQSFLDYLYQEDENPMFKGMVLGKFVTTTPCFRSEVYDDLHKPWFIKTELIWTGVHENKSLWLVISDAINFFNKYTDIKVTDTFEGYDLLDYTTGIELGSYGIREYGETSYVYGTGVAEPRLSYVLDGGKW